MARWFIKDHACERFAQRIDHNTPTNEVREILERALHKNAARLRRDTRSGEHRYLIEKPRCVAIVEPPRDVWDDVHTVVTIVPARGDFGADWVAPNSSKHHGEWKPEHHPDWQDLRDETRGELAMMLLRCAMRSDVRAPIQAWIGR